MAIQTVKRLIQIQAVMVKGAESKVLTYLLFPLCATCHAAFDRFELGNRAESEAMFEKWLVKTELMMNQTDKEVF